MRMNLARYSHSLKGPWTKAFAALIVAAPIAVAGCSSKSGAKQDAKAPAAVAGKAKSETKKAEPEVKKVGRGSRKFPNLSTVPGRPKTTTPEQRLEIEEGLLADRARARHSDATPPWARPKTASNPTATGGEGQAPAVMTVMGRRLATIRFPVGSARLPPGAAGLMRQIAALQKRFNARVVAVGHTSRRKRNNDQGKDQAAKTALSLARANSVVSMLSRMGVKQDRLQAVGRADTEPNDRRRPFLNRRVDIFMRQ